MTNLKKPVQSIGIISDNILYVLKLCMKHCPFYTILKTTMSARDKIWVFFKHTFMLMYMVDIIQYKKSPYPGFRLLIIFAAYEIFFRNVFRKFLMRHGQKASIRLQNIIKMKLFEKAAAIDLACYDDPKYYNDFVFVMRDAASRIENTLASIGQLFGCITSFILTGILFLSFDTLGFVFILVSFLFSFSLNLVINKLQFGLDMALRPLQRKRDYINRVFYLNDFAKEIRMHPIKQKLMADYTAANDAVKTELQKKTNRISILSYIRDYLFGSFILDGLYVIYLLYQTIVKATVSYGAMTALFDSVWKLKYSLQEFTTTLPAFQQHSLYIGELRAFLNYEVKIKDTENAAALPESLAVLELNNVSFSYQEKGPAVLKNISMTIHPGEKIALVGYNGAGKTTLVKLLMRLYDVSGGMVTYAGKNIIEYKTAEYRRLFSTIFQDYQLFAATLAENVVMDSKAPNEIKLMQALSQSGFKNRLSSLPDGVHTYVTKEFEPSGIEFSIGEAQKIAISRALYHNSSIIILDEPSSALDPIAEYNLNRTMLLHSSDKTVIFISHRLSAARHADRIYMMEAGQIIESGTHDELMALNGKYAEMFLMQAEKYTLYQM